jgi:hypothetical protein
MAQQTPEQVEMQQTGTSPANVKIEMGGGLPMQFKLANAFSLIIAGVVAVAVTAVLADGMSVIKVKDASELPVITNPAYKTYGIDHNVAELLGETYGIACTTISRAVAGPRLAARGPSRCSRTPLAFR